MCFRVTQPYRVKTIQWPMLLLMQPVVHSRVNTDVIRAAVQYSAI